MTIDQKLDWLWMSCIGVIVAVVALIVWVTR
jgi:hypothetical protein